MSDLIRREDAIAEVSKEFKNSIIGTHCAVNAIYRVPSAQPESSEVARDIATIIENEMDMRVIAQTEIIRCKDCKYCEHWYADKGRCFLWHEGGIDVFEDGFCNYAERREEE